MKYQPYRNKKGHDYAYYACDICEDRHSVRSDYLEPYVARAALSFVASLEPDSPIMVEVSRRMLAAFSPEQVNRRSEIVDEIEALDGRMRKFRQENLTGVLGDDEYNNLSENATMRHNDLVDEMATLPEVRPDLGILFDLCQASDDPDDIVGEGSAWAALEHHRRREILRVLVDHVTVERRAKPSLDIIGRTTIEFCREDNVIQLGQRTDKTRRFSTAAKVAV